jgi:hypothetical protein
MIPALVAAHGKVRSSTGNSKSRSGNTNGSGANRVKRIGEQSRAVILPEGEYAKGMAYYDMKERQLEAQLITNKIKVEVSANVADKITDFRQRKLEEVNSMSEADLKTLLKTHDYKKPTPLLNRFKKGLMRGLTLRKSNNSRNELVELAKRTYIPDVVGAERWRLENEAGKIAVGKLTNEEKARYEEEKDWKIHKDEGYIRVTVGQGISPYTWVSKEQNEADIADFMGSMGVEKR